MDNLVVRRFRGIRKDNESIRTFSSAGRATDS